MAATTTGAAGPVTSGRKARVAPPVGAARVAARYLLLLAGANLAWEIGHLPLHALWRERGPSEIAWAVLHCTAGDVAVGAAALGAVIVLTRARRWPDQGFAGVATAASAADVAATVVLEWLDVEVWRNWAYAEAMPRLPPFGTGLSPLLQWLLLPPSAFSRRAAGPALPSRSSEGTHERTPRARTAPRPSQTRAPAAAEAAATTRDPAFLLRRRRQLAHVHMLHAPDLGRSSSPSRSLGPDY